MWSETFRNVLEGPSCRPNQQWLCSNNPILGTLLTHACLVAVGEDSAPRSFRGPPRRNGAPLEARRAYEVSRQECTGSATKKPTQCLSMCCGRLPTFFFFVRDNLCRVLLRWPQADTLHRARGLAVRGGGVLLPALPLHLEVILSLAALFPKNITYTSQCVRYRFKPFFYRISGSSRKRVRHWW